MDTIKDAVVGDFKWSARQADFTGWLLCDGSSLDRTTYSALFAVIDTKYGSTSSTTFKLPDCRGRVPGAIGAGPGLTRRATGENPGAETHVLTTPELPGHTHDGTTNAGGTHTHGVSDPGHTHTQTTINDDFNNSGGAGPSFAADSAGSRTWSNIVSSATGVTVNSGGSHIHTFTTNSTGGGVAFDIMQPTIFLGNVFIYSGLFEPHVGDGDIFGNDDAEYAPSA